MLERIAQKRLQRRPVRLDAVRPRIVSEELTREWEWSERYPGPPEILRYLNHVADRFDLKRDIRFNTRVTAAHYDETENLWWVSTDAGETLTAQFLITATAAP